MVEDNVRIAGVKDMILIGARVRDRGNSLTVAADDVGIRIQGSRAIESMQLNTIKNGKIQNLKMERGINSCGRNRVISGKIKNVNIWHNHRQIPAYVL
jgi:hypothetical protein